MLDLTAFGPGAAPVKTHQYTFGVNYYFYPTMMLQFAYEINHEVDVPLHDNIFMAQLAWGW